ncbi:MAG: hypothetical protein ACPG8W_00385 [Candidatus Promineifilaceae bacterium]
MKRLHLFEFEDLPWLPNVVRDGITDFLQHIANEMNSFKSVAPLLAEAMEATGTTEILDMCSGGGGGMLKLQVALEEAMGHPVPMTLSDKYPNLPAFAEIQKASGGKISFEREGIDATNVLSEKKAFRTMFRAFHHFRKPTARQILQNAVDNNAPIAIFEQTDRTWKGVRGVAIFIPIGVLMMTPSIRPRKTSRFLLTYLFPIIPFCLWWDGIVSALRTYTPEELQQMVDEIGATHYEWKIGDTGRANYLIGYPKV